MRWTMTLLAAAVLVAHSGANAARALELPANDYPTAARADYVFGCMQVNGQTRDALERCSCSIDVIASLLPFIAPLPFYFLELFVGLIQAFVFALLTLVFFRVATAEAH